MSEDIPFIELADFSYELPEERIAQFPLNKRDDAKLLIYTQGDIAHSRFYKLHHFLASGSLLVFNNTKVIPARLLFQRATGATIEVLLLEPVEPKLVNQTMQCSEACTWHCIIGNKKKWKEGEVLSQKINIDGQETHLEAHLQDRDKQYVQLKWDNPHLSFAEMIQHYGTLPLPPYMKRNTQVQDYEQYQTVYSHEQGAVASPTAGLHFTEEVLENISRKGICKDFITLHVSGATFQPIKTEQVSQHPMHAEQIIFTQKNIENILAKIDNIVAVGTTSMRALESLYWFGVKLYKNQNLKLIPFFVEKLYPYSIPQDQLPDRATAIGEILKYMKKHNLEQLFGGTEIFIFPGYPFQMTKALITNYHLPNTTLILLVAAYIKEDWKKVYQEALDNDYRFLSYGDSSLLMP